MGLKELRQERDLSQEQLAAQSGLSLRTIQRVEAGGRAGKQSRRALARACEVEEADLVRELGGSKSSAGWKKRPAWLRALFLGSTRIRMDRRQHQAVELVSVVAGVLLVLVAVFKTGGSIVSESATVPLLLCGCLMILVAYLVSLVVRLADRHSAWPWLITDKTDA